MSNRINTESLESFLESYKNEPEHFRNHMADVYKEVQREIADAKTAIGNWFERKFLHVAKCGGILNNSALAEHFIGEDETNADLTKKEREELIEEKKAELDLRDATNAIVNIVNAVWKQGSYRHTDGLGANFSFPNEEIFRFVSSLAYHGALVYRFLDRKYEDETKVAVNALKKALFEQLKKDLGEKD